LTTNPRSAIVAPAMKLPPPPRLTGRALRGVVRATDAEPVRHMRGKLLRADLGIVQIGRIRLGGETHEFINL
jgi:hypothetical protein